MTVPRAVVRRNVLAMFSRAAENGIAAQELLVIMAVGMAANGEDVNLRLVMLFTELDRETALECLKRMKEAGHIDQLGAGYFLTRLGREILANAEEGEATA